MNKHPKKLRSTRIERLALAGMLTCLGMASAHAQVVVRDLATGEFRAPTAAEAKQLEELNRAMASRVPRGVLTGTLNPRPVRLPGNGGDILEATDADINYSVVVLGPNGKLTRHCVANPELAERIGRGELAAFAPNMMERLHER